MHRFDYHRNYTKLASHAMRASILEDYDNYLQTCIANAEEALASGGIGELFKFVTKIMPSKYSKGSKASRIHNSDGVPASTVAEEKAIFLEHFEKLLHGLKGSFAELIDIDTNMYSSPLPLVPNNIDIYDIPTVGELADQFARRNPNKAFGEGCICGKLLKHFAFILASLYYPLLFLMHARAMPPLQWKGGMITELFKKGSPALINNYGIFCSLMIVARPPLSLSAHV